MHHRFRNALRQSSEATALFVLIIVFILRAYRITQHKWNELPGILQVVAYIQDRTNVWVDRNFYEAHWL